jgi:FKBP-type peptidyl-prolyl cis-trans isomerase FkpA
MKLTSRIALLIIVLITGFTACKEDEYMDWKIRNEKWMDQLKIDHEKDTTFHITSSGLCYQVLYQGWSYERRPDANSYVYATYTGKLIDGSTFESGTDAYLGQVSSFVPGFQEGIKKMNTGGSYIFYIPSPIGYDTVSTNSQIPPYSTLIFTVDLVDSY